MESGDRKEPLRGIPLMNSTLSLEPWKSSSKGNTPITQILRQLLQIAHGHRRGLNENLFPPKITSDHIMLMQKSHVITVPFLLGHSTQLTRVTDDSRKKAVVKTPVTTLFFN